MPIKQVKIFKKINVAQKSAIIAIIQWVWPFLLWSTALSSQLIMLLPPTSAWSANKPHCWELV